MAKIWRNRIIAGDKQYTNCPAIYKPGVKALLKQDVENGIITAEAYKKITGETYETGVPAEAG